MNNPEQLDTRTRYVAKLRNPLCDDIYICCLADNPQQVIDYAATLCWKVVAIQANCGYVPHKIKFIRILK